MAQNEWFYENAGQRQGPISPVAVKECWTEVGNLIRLNTWSRVAQVSMLRFKVLLWRTNGITPRTESDMDRRPSPSSKLWLVMAGCVAKIWFGTWECALRLSRSPGTRLSTEATGFPATGGGTAVLANSTRNCHSTPWFRPLNYGLIKLFRICPTLTRS